MIRLNSKEKSKGLKRTPIKHTSKKMQKQRRQEDKLSLKLAELSGNRCEICKLPPDFRGLHKHEIVRRGQQGDELDPLNTLLICLRDTCHNHRKYPKTGTPLSIEEQLELAKKLHASIVLTK